ncbi:enoyl-CoA hydratase-related protein [Asanoa iriomotensis]|uniref:Hydrogenase maturation protein n=1 Tax=Asanoa iriomotensis TaxID=234613 RepID=A0ABQ4C823_9ACTN|nr:enoyl-CoA hydratase-related protein [Asanoa iriomotensis]GIF58941.1 hydrogenase maturation protein [Asanoa iriomotensis]
MISRRVLLMSNAFGGATMAAYCWLRDRGIETAFQPATSPAAMLDADLWYAPDLILAPTLTTRVPAELFGKVVINHPGRLGDRGASSIDWGRWRRERFGGTTLLLAADGWDTGDVVHTTTFGYPTGPATKSWIYSHLNRGALLRGLERLLDAPVPRPLDYAHADVLGRWNDVLRAGDSTVDWSLAAEEVVWRVAARDGAPGVRAELLGEVVSVFDVHPAGPARGEPGEVVAWLPDSAVRVVCGPAGGDGLRDSVWVGHVKARGFKQPAAWWLGGRVSAWQDAPIPYRPVTTTLRGSVAVITAAAYNGAWSTGFCHAVASAVTAAARRTDVDQIVLRGGGTGPFGNGINLNHVYGAPAGVVASARANIRAINKVGLALFQARRDGVSVLVLLDGDAGAGGAFLSLCGDVVVAVPGRTFNYHYVGMGGLTGSEFHTLTLPSRMPDEEARSALLHDCLPLSADQAHRQGLVDYLAPEGLAGEDLTEWTHEFAVNHRDTGKRADRQRWRPLPTEAELAATQDRELRRIDADFASQEFQAALAAFVLKHPGPPPRAATEYRGAYAGSSRIRNVSMPGSESWSVSA